MYFLVEGGLCSHSTPMFMLLTEGTFFGAFLENGSITSYCRTRKIVVDTNLPHYTCPIF